jgi:hypothetical protein
VSDGFDLMGQQPDDRRGGPSWQLVLGIVLAGLLVLTGAGWMVASMVSSGTRVEAAAAPSSTPAPTTPPATTPERATATATPAPVPTTPSATPTTPRPTVTVPRPPVTTVAVPTPAPTPAPVRTTPKKAPTLPKPKPTPGNLVTVPEVVGLKVKSAVVTVQDAGLRATILGGAFAPGPRDDRRVTAQSPAAGTKVPRGTMVTLTTDGL